MAAACILRSSLEHVFRDSRDASTLCDTNINSRGSIPPCDTVVKLSKAGFCFKTQVMTRITPEAGTFQEIQLVSVFNAAGYEIAKPLVRAYAHS